MFFYYWVFEIVVYGGHVEVVNKTTIRHMSLPIFYGASWFISCYIIFSLFIPYINRLLNMLTGRQYLELLLLVFMLTDVLQFFHVVTFMDHSRILFFTFVYAIGGFIQLHCSKYITAKYRKRYFMIFLLLLAVAIVSILVKDYIGYAKDSDKYIKEATAFAFSILSVLIANFFFLMFISMKPFYNKAVNTIAGTVLGVYLIHDNDILRNIIWHRIFPNEQFFNMHWYFLFMIIEIIAIFCICSLIEYLRMQFIEGRVKACVDKRWDGCAIKANKISNMLYDKIVRFIDK